MAIVRTLFFTILGSRNPETGDIEPPYTPAQVLWVDQSIGSDTVSNGLGPHGSEINPFATFNKAQSVLQPSGEIHAKAGRYFESTVDNPFVPDQVLATSVFAATAPLVSGTIFHRCVMRAAAGHEGAVIIDGGGTLAGLVTEGKNNWYIYGLRFENCMNAGIASLGGAVLTPDFSKISSNWLVENCCVTSVDSYSTGGNVSGIAPWGTQDWVIRNCKIYDIRRNAGVNANLVANIQTYGAINLFVQHCHFEQADFGFFAKDHFLYPDLETPYKGATFDSCYMDTRSRPFYLGVRGGGTAHCGETIVRNCILRNRGSGEGGGATVSAEMGAGLGQSTDLLVEHCIIRADDATTKLSVISGFANVRLRNNINIGGLNQIQINNQGHPTVLTECNRNAYADFDYARMNANGAGDVNLSWAVWPTSVAGSPSSLGVSNPDSLSVISTPSAMFIDMDADDYRFKAGSPTIGLAGGGLNAGPYQTSLEHIGLLPTYSAGA